MSVWTDDRVERLKLLLRQGMSASAIAERLGGGMSRNAVIGKVHRMGLKLDQRSSSERSANARKSRKKTHKKQCAQIFKPPPYMTLPVEPLPHGPEPHVPRRERRGVLELEDNQCRWPIGDPKDADFHFCNAKRVTGFAYCAHHARRAYRPVDMKQRVPQRTRVFTPEDVEV